MASREVLPWSQLATMTIEPFYGSCIELVAIIRFDEGQTPLFCPPSTSMMAP
jgi:hypothetical protein